MEFWSERTVHCIAYEWLATGLRNSTPDFMMFGELGRFPLHTIELGRFHRPPTPLQDRICKMCDTNVVENEIHFLGECALYNDIRSGLWKIASDVDSAFSLLNPTKINISYGKYSAQQIFSRYNKHHVSSPALHYSVRGIL